MTAFDELREPTDPIAPDRAFAARLRRRVAEVLGAPDGDPATTGVPTVDVQTVDVPTVDVPTVDVPTVDLPERSPVMTDTTATTTTATTATAAHPATGATTVVPYISIAGAADAIDWYASVLGAVETVRYTGDDGRIGHAEIDVGGARIMLSDEYPDFGAIGPRTLGGTSVALHLMVPDVDAVWERAVARGADGKRPPEDQPYGDRSCTFVDPFGHRWSVGTHIADPTTAEIEAAMEGYTITSPAGSDDAAARDATAASAEPVVEPVVELGYCTLGFDDTARAERFYGALFGWKGEQGSAGEGYVHIANTTLPMGLTPDGVGSPPQLYFRVDSMERYASRVRDLGGAVVSEATYASGRNAVCRDDQGREFQLWEPAPGY